MNSNRNDLTTQRIDRILTALAETQPAPGLERRVERRVLAVLDARSSNRPLWTRLNHRLLPPPVALLSGLATLAAIALCVSLFSNSPLRPATSVARSPGPSPTAFRAALETSTANRQNLPVTRTKDFGSHTPSPLSPVMLPPVMFPPVMHPLHAESLSAPGIRHPDSSTSAAPLSESDALALAETQEPSHPAPDLPLTAQEKLLLRMAHRHTTRDLAAFDSIARDEQLATDQAQFLQFFDLFPKGDKNENNN